jgi:Nucleotidyl transferase AbiEii toxin, Type IV TA system
MQALEFWKTVTVDHANLLESLIGLLHEHKVKYCVIGGQAVNAYAEPVVSLDLDLVIATEQLLDAERWLAERFEVRRFPHSLNVSLQGSKLRVQIQTDPRYATFVERAIVRDVLDVKLPVAQLDDLLRGKIWAASDPERRASKRQKDLADIARLIENYPQLRSEVPAEILSKLV